MVEKFSRVPFLHRAHSAQAENCEATNGKSLTIAGKSLWGKNRALRVHVTFCILWTQANVLLVFKAFSFLTGGTRIA